MRSLSYQEWSESEGRVVRNLRYQTVTNEEIFVRKLVNATLINDQLYEHTSHESDEHLNHFIYLKPFDGAGLGEYGVQIKSSSSEASLASSFLEADFMVWHEYAFTQSSIYRPAMNPLDIAQLLLDHYITDKEKTFETIYTVFDMVSNKVVFYLKEVSFQ